MDIHKKLRDARIAAKLSQSELAGLLNVNQSAVSRIENGDHEVRIDTVQRYADVTGETITLVFRPRK